MTGIGLYTSAPRLKAFGAADVLAEVDELGFDTLWIANVQADLPVLDAALAGTQRMTIGSAIVSIWDVPAPELAAWWDGRKRLRLGIGVSHGPLVPAYAKPLAALQTYVDDLDTAGLPATARLVGANGPKMLSLTAARSAGALTYLVTPEQTAVHRGLLGDAPRLIPEVKAVLDTDAARARETARQHLSVYLGLPNYLGNLRRMGFTEDDLAAPGSDRLVDALVVHGDVEAVRARVDAHIAAGADGAAVHVLGTEPLPLPAWRLLADALLSGAAP